MSSSGQDAQLFDEFDAAKTWARANAHTLTVSTQCELYALQKQKEEGPYRNQRELYALQK